jgi:biopolymer transport protein TolR
MSMAVGGGKKGGPVADINVTPMADIMIVLLIIFMVITPMLQKGVDVKLPLAANSQEKKEQPKLVEVAIKLDKSTFLKGLRIDRPEEFVPKVKEALEELPETERVVFLKADTNLAYSEVMKVMDLLREAGVEEIALIAERRTGGAV